MVNMGPVNKFEHVEKTSQHHEHLHQSVDNVYNETVIKIAKMKPEPTFKGSALPPVSCQAYLKLSVTGLQSCDMPLKKTFPATVRISSSIK